MSGMTTECCGCATTRPLLLALSNKAPGSRVLDDGFANIGWVAMVPKGKAGHIAYVGDFLEQAKMTGLVKHTIDQANLRGLQVAPSGKANLKAQMSVLGLADVTARLLIGRSAMRTMIAASLFAALVTSMSHAQKANTVTCTGPLIDISLRPNASLAVIYDTKGGYSCAVDRHGSGHDPLRSCSMGQNCRLVGTYSRKNDTTYVIDHISSVEAVQ